MTEAVAVPVKNKGGRPRLQRGPTNVELPIAFSDLPYPQSKARYKVYWGGRGSGKDWAFAIAAISLAMDKRYHNLSFLCCREIQKTIKDSFYKLLCNTIERIGVQSAFYITDENITCTLTGARFSFVGLFRNIDGIKSFEDASVCILTEAQPCSEESLELLFPTIRGKGLDGNSEIWINFNPKYPDDAIYRRFVVNRPPEAIVRQVSWQDNPWFPDVLKIERDNDYRFRPSEARCIWEGVTKGYGGLVWPAFDEAKHVREFDLSTVKHNIYMAVDPHSAHYSFAVWIAKIVKSKDEYYYWCFAEYPRFSHVNAYYSEIRKSLQYTGTYADLSREWFATEIGHKVHHRYVDTRFALGSGAGNWTNKTEGLTQEFAKPENGGIFLEQPPVTSIDQQRGVIRTLMAYNTLAPISVMNEPHFYVSSSCKNVLQSLKNHRFEEDSEKEDEKYKDASDSLRIVMAGISTAPFIDAEKKKFTLNLDYSTSPDGWMGN